MPHRACPPQEPPFWGLPELRLAVWGVPPSPRFKGDDQGPRGRGASCVAAGSPRWARGRGSLVPGVGLGA